MDNKRNKLIENPEFLDFTLIACEDVPLSWGHPSPGRLISEFPFPVVRLHSALSPIEVNMPVKIIQHPLGGPKTSSFDKVTAVTMNHIRYDTSTKSGSSGSPVVNNQFQLIALHHGGCADKTTGKFYYNRAVLFSSIVEYLCSHHGFDFCDPPAPPPPTTFTMTVRLTL